MTRARDKVLPTVLTALLGLASVVAVGVGRPVSSTRPAAQAGARAGSQAGAQVAARSVATRLSAVTTASTTLLATPPAKRPHPHGTPPPKRPHPKRKPWPVTVTVQTVPALAGVHFSWDGKVQTTDKLGRLSITAEHNFALHTLKVLDKALVKPDQRFRFVRWAGQRNPDLAYVDTVTGLPQRENYTVMAGYSVQSPVTVRFVDQQSRPVDPTRIAQITLRTDTGAVQPLATVGTTWLDGTLPRYRGTTLDTRDATYSVQSVMVSGTNTVDVGQQTFKPAKTSEVVVTTKFFDLTVRAHDLLSHGATGKSARVTFPDGTVHPVVFGPDGSGTLSNLPRGIYNVDIKGAGTAIPAQVTLSRNATVDLVVATRGDMAALGGAGLGIAAALVLFGRARRGLFRAVTTTVLGWMGLTPRRTARRMRVGARA